MNTPPLTLRQIMNQIELAVSVSERKVREIDALLSGSGSDYDGADAKDKPIGIVESAHGILERLSHMQSTLDTIRGMLAPSQNVAGQALGDLARPRANVMTTDFRDGGIAGY